MTFLLPRWICILGLLAGIAAWAQTPPSRLEDLVVRNGMLSQGTQQTPATMRQIVDLLMAFSPQVQITIVGAEDVVIENVTVRIGRRRITNNEVVEPSMHSVLMALRAASGNRFEVQPFGPHDFLLTALQRQSRYAEVFNLAPLFKSTRVAQLNQQLRELEAELRVQTRIKTADHPDVKHLQERISVLKAHIADAGGPKVEPAKLVQTIDAVVQDTLRMLKPADKSPEFSYHAESNLLIVVGGDHALEVTRKVIAALTQSG